MITITTFNIKYKILDWNAQLNALVNCHKHFSADSKNIWKYLIMGH